MVHGAPWHGSKCPGPEHDRPLNQNICFAALLKKLLIFNYVNAVNDRENIGDYCAKFIEWPLKKCICY